MRLLLVIATAALAAGILPSLVHGGVLHGDLVIASAQLAISFIVSLGIGYVAAGIVLLATWGRAGWPSMAIAAILVLLFWAAASYLGMLDESAARNVTRS